MAGIVDRRAALLEAISASGANWINRGSLAEATGKRILSPNDRRWLETLEREGLIEARQEPIKGPQGYEWQYRATAKE